MCVSTEYSKKGDVVLLSNPKRKCFVSFLLCVVRLLLWLSLNIWNIPLNWRNVKFHPQLDDFWTNKNYSQDRKNQIALYPVADLLRKTTRPDITLFPSRVQGTGFLPFRKNQNLTEDIQQTKSPCNLFQSGWQENCEYGYQENSLVNWQGLLQKQGIQVVSGSASQSK